MEDFEGISKRSLMNKYKKELRSLQNESKALISKIKDKGEKKKIQAVYDQKIKELTDAHTASIGGINVEQENDVFNDRKVEASNSSFYLENGLTKVNKHRENKSSKAAAAFNDLVQQCASEVNFVGDNSHVLELKSIEEKLFKLNLELHSVGADGNCLFNAINHQLKLHDIVGYTANSLRLLAVKYIEEHSDFFSPYFCEENSCGDIATYCNQMRNENEWGGDLEITALVFALELRICVICGLDYQDQFYGNNKNGILLYIVYHRYLLSTGPHYNSTIVKKDDKFLSK